MRATRWFVVFVAGAAVVVGACGGDSAKPAASATPTSAPPATNTPASSSSAPVTPSGTDDQGRISDAATVGAFLVNTAKSWGDDALDLYKLADGLQRVYPKLDLSGSAVDATPTTISAAATSVDDKDVASAKNPHILVFAIVDTTGTCRGRVVYGYPTTDKELPAKGGPGTKCTAEDVLKFARATIPAKAG
jgi:hypothetical protein